MADAAFLRAIRDRRHPKRASCLEWIGGAHDPAAFDADAVNQALPRIWPRREPAGESPSPDTRR